MNVPKHLDFETRCYFGGGSAPTPAATPAPSAPVPTPATPASQPVAGTQVQAAQRLYVADGQNSQILGNAASASSKTGVKPVLGG